MVGQGEKERADHGCTLGTLSHITSNTDRLRNAGLPGAESSAGLGIQGRPVGAGTQGQADRREHQDRRRRHRAAAAANHDAEGDAERLVFVGSTGVVADIVTGRVRKKEHAADEYAASQHTLHPAKRDAEKRTGTEVLDRVKRPHDCRGSSVGSGRTTDMPTARRARPGVQHVAGIEPDGLSRRLARARKAVP